jgi:pimeloyl-ACP methyl ester carboxylesterase
MSISTAMKSRNNVKRLGIVGIVLIFVFAVPTVLHSTNEPDLTGGWRGSLATPRGELRLILALDRTWYGAYSGTVESIDQNPGEMIQMSHVSVANGKLRFAVEQFGASYVGTVVEQGTRIQGTLSQGRNLDLVFERSEGVPEIRFSTARPQHPVGIAPYQIEEVSFHNVDDTEVVMSGTLTVPESDGPFPVVILISGSGPQDRDQTVFDHRPFWVLADTLTRAGIAVLRYDDRGTAQSTGDYGSATIADFASDAQAAVQFLANHPEREFSAIGLAGHSEGGLVAPIVARLNPDVEFLVLLAAPAVPIRELMLAQTREFLEVRGDSAAIIERGMPIQAQLMDIAGRDTSHSTAVGEINAVLTDEELAALGEPRDARDQVIGSMLRPWYRHIIIHDPAPYLSDLNIPVLAMIGSKDTQVDPATNLDALRRNLANTQDSTIVELPGLNHLFQTAQTGSMDEYGMIEQTFHPEAMARIISWIDARF